MEYQSGIGIGLSGRYCVQVIDSTTNAVVKDYGWNKNLILNSGMDAVASNFISNLSAYAACGEGNRPNYITSSTSTITQSANYIGMADFTGIASFNQSLDTNGTRSYNNLVTPGDLIIDQDMSQSVVITSSFDGTTLTISGSGFTYTTPKTFTIWKTSQTGLQSESQRTNTYLAGQCGTTISGTMTSMRRTFNFAVESQTRSYAEVGCGWHNTGPLFSRVVLPQTVSLVPNQQLRMIYDLNVSYGPTGSFFKSINITGWPVAPSTTTTGTESLQNFLVPIVDSNGNPTGNGPNGCYTLDPSATYTPSSTYNYSCYPFSIFASDVSASVYTGSIGYATGVNRPGDYTTIAPTLGNYITGTYTNTKSAYFSIYQANLLNIRSIGFGTLVTNQFSNPVIYPYDPTGSTMVFVFDQPQAKTNYQTLTFAWRWTWNRIIQ
jgi:hypothetical protein